MDNENQQSKQQKEDKPLNELLTSSLIDLYVGPDSTHWTIHEGLLTHHSSVFSSETDKPQSSGLEKRGDKSWALPEDDDATFELFVGWLYSRSIRPPSVEKDIGPLLDLYLLSEKLQIEKLSLDIVDLVREFYHSTSSYPGLRRVQYIYNETEDDNAMREMMVSSIARQLTTGDKIPLHWATALKRNGQLAVDIIRSIQQWHIEERSIPDARDGSQVRGRKAKGGAFSAVEREGGDSIDTTTAETVDTNLGVESVRSETSADARRTENDDQEEDAEDQQNGADDDGDDDQGKSGKEERNPSSIKSQNPNHDHDYNHRTATARPLNARLEPPDKLHQLRPYMQTSAEANGNQSEDSASDDDNDDDDDDVDSGADARNPDSQPKKSSTKPPPTHSTSDNGYTNRLLALSRSPTKATGTQDLALLTSYAQHNNASPRRRRRRPSSGSPTSSPPPTPSRTPTPTPNPTLALSTPSSPSPSQSPSSKPPSRRGNISRLVSSMTRAETLLLLTLWLVYLVYNISAYGMENGYVLRSASSGDGGVRNRWGVGSGSGFGFGFGDKVGSRIGEKSVRREGRWN